MKEMFVVPSPLSRSSFWWCTAAVGVVFQNRWRLLSDLAIKRSIRAHCVGLGLIIAAWWIYNVFRPTKEFHDGLWIAIATPIVLLIWYGWTMLSHRGNNK